MSPNQRIVLNTAASYARSLVGAGLALFSSRWVLNALGETDFGLFCVVGSIIVFITILNSAMGGSAARHFSYAIGKGDSGEVNGWFNAAVSIHLCMAVVLVLIGWPIGEYVIGNLLTIPVDRIPACLWVFRVSLVAAFVGMVSIPFMAMFTAHQYMVEPSVWGMLTAILTFSLAYMLTSVTGDRLLFYAIGMVAIVVALQVTQVFRAVVVFTDCRIVIRHWFDRSRLKEIFSFAIWNLIGGLGETLRNQGSAILLNVYAGPSVNASYGIANQVSNQTNQLTNAMLVALGPEITASEGRGDRSRVIDLAFRASKFGTILVMLFAIPLILEMDYVLKLWLREPPEYTAIFCQLILCTFVLDRLTAGHMLAVNAYGKLAGCQATLGTILVLTLPLGWIFLALGSPPTSVGIAFVITMAVCSLGRVLWGRHLLGMPIFRWLREVVCPCGMVAMLGIVAALSPVWLMPPSFLRLALTILAGVLTCFLSTWLLALDGRERTFLRENVHRILKRIRFA